MRRAKRILPFRGLEVQGCGADYFAVFGSARFPVRLDWSPEVFSEAFDISITVLCDQGSDCFWPFESKTESDWRTVIEDVHGEFLDREGVEEG